MSGLTSREREVLRLRFGEDVTQAEIDNASASRRCLCRGSSAARSSSAASTPDDARHDLQPLRPHRTTRRLDLAS